MSDFTNNGQGNASRNIYKNLGIVFGFGNSEEKVQESTAIGHFQTTHTNGRVCYWQLLSSLVEGIWHRARWPSD